MLFATIYLANAVNAIMPILYDLGYLCQCVMINERVVFSFTNETMRRIHSSKKH